MRFGNEPRTLPNSETIPVDAHATLPPRRLSPFARECARDGVDHPRYLLRLIELELLDRERRTVDAAASIGRYIDGFYNPVRRHSALDFTSPAQFVKMAIT